MTTLSLTDRQVDALRRLLELQRQRPSSRKERRRNHRGHDIYCIDCDERYRVDDEEDEGEDVPVGDDEVELSDLRDMLRRPRLKAVGS